MNICKSDTDVALIYIQFPFDLLAWNETDLILAMVTWLFLPFRPFVVISLNAVKRAFKRKTMGDFTLATHVNLGKVKTSKILITLLSNHIQKNRPRAEH